MKAGGPLLTKSQHISTKDLSISATCTCFKKIKSLQPGSNLFSLLLLSRHHQVTRWLPAQCQKQSLSPSSAQQALILLDVQSLLDPGHLSFLCNSAFPGQWTEHQNGHHPWVCSFLWPVGRGKGPKLPGWGLLGLGWAGMSLFPVSHQMLAPPSQSRAITVL